MSKNPRDDASGGKQEKTGAKSKQDEGPTGNPTPRGDKDPKGPQETKEATEDRKNPDGPEDASDRQVDSGWPTVVSLVGALLVLVGGLFWSFGGATTGAVGALSSGMVLIGMGSLAMFRGDARPDPSAQSVGLGTWTRFKVGLFLLYNLLFIPPALLLIAGVTRLDSFQGIDRMLLGLAVVASLLVVVLGRWSMKMPLDAAAAGRRPGTVIGLLFAVLLVAAGIAFYLSYVSHEVWAPAKWSGVGAWALLGVFYLSRPLPSPRSLFLDERQVFHGVTHLTRQKSLWMPFVVALAATVWLLLAVVLYGIRIEGLYIALMSPWFRGALVGALALAFAVTIHAFLLVSRSDHLPVYQPPQSRERRQVMVIFGISGVLVAVFLGLMVFALRGGSVGAFRPGPGNWVEFLGLAVMSAVGPYGFYHAKRQRRIARLEDRFPGFLRDLAAARRAGLTLEQAIMMAREGDYGELGPEIEKMADQLSWKMPFEQVLQEFSDRVDTPLVQRAVSLIKEASWTGGNIASVLDAASKDAQEIQKIMSERRTTTRVYTGIVYIGLFIFIGVAAVLYMNLVPELVGAAQELSESGADPDRIAGLSVNPDVTLTDFRVFYFIAALAQAVGGGFVAGLMGSGSWPNGLSHIFMMCGMAVLAFALLG